MNLGILNCTLSGSSMEQNPKGLNLSHCLSLTRLKSRPWLSCWPFWRLQGKICFQFYLGDRQASACVGSGFLLPCLLLPGVLPSLNISELTLYTYSLGSPIVSVSLLLPRSLIPKLTFFLFLLSPQMIGRSPLGNLR